MRPPTHHSFLISLALLSSYLTAALLLLGETPLPVRTGVSKDKDGTALGHYGDDWIPQHMQYVKDNQEEFPQNKKPFPVNDSNDRPKKISDKKLPNH